MNNEVNQDVYLNTRNEREYLGFNLFDQVDDAKTQAWNRTMTFLNILDLKGHTCSVNYLGLLNKRDKEAVNTIIKDMRERGFTKVKKEVWDNHVLTS